MTSKIINNSITLNNGIKMPFMGLGTWESMNAAPVVHAALSKGYRMIDTASFYANEKECGEGIMQWINESPENKRSDVFYITKLWNNENGYHVAKEAIDKCLARVKGLEYIDLLLIHSPLEGPKMRLETWKAMQEAVEEGKVKSIGVSNYGIDHLKELLNWEGLKIKPVVNEIEVHPWCMRQELCDFTIKMGLKVVAFAPLSHSYRLQDKNVIEISKEKDISAAQVLIRWSLEKGYIPIPKTKTISRLSGNLDVLSFELSADEIAKLDHPNEHDPSDWEVTTCP
ncbi:aldo-keto reductase superfamily protein [Martiniozyma asiatica (nom. inval.)]|nr:aldo-keto reductase superfamily protein [Martiniozyma asiatica]